VNFSLIGAIPGLALLISAWLAGSWLGGWCGAMTAAAGWFLAPQFSRDRQKQPFRGWLAVLLLAVGGAVGTVLLATRQQETDVLDLVGVFLANGEGPITVGVGLPRSDVRLEESERDLDRWAISVEQKGAGYAIGAIEGVDWIERRYAKGASKVIVGAQLDRETPSVKVRSLDGVVHDVALRDEGRFGTIVVDRFVIPLESSSEVGKERLSRDLSNGVALSSLVMPGAGVPTLLACLQIAVSERPKWKALLQGASIVVGSRAPDCVIIDSRSSDAVAMPGDTLRVVSRGRAWRFVVTDAMGPSGRTGTEIRFSRRPRQRIAALPGPAVCDQRTACRIVSSHPLPPPVAYLNIGRNGLDTSRYRLLGRIDSDTLVLLGRRVPLPPNQEVRVAFSHPVSATDAGAILRLRRPTASGLAPRLLEIIAVGMMWLAAGLLVMRLPWMRALLVSGDVNAAFAWSILYVTTMMAGLRLGLGLRATLAEPYVERGAETSYGLWVSVPLVVLLLAAISHAPAWWMRFRGERTRRADSVTVPVATIDEERWGGGLPAWVIIGGVALFVYLDLNVLKGAFAVVGAFGLAWLSAVGTNIVARGSGNPIRMLFHMRASQSLQYESLRLIRFVFAVVMSLRFRPASAIVVATVALAWASFIAIRLWRLRAVRSAEIVEERMGLTSSMCDLVAIIGLSLMTYLVDGPFALFAALFAIYLAAIRAGMIYSAWSATTAVVDWKSVYVLRPFLLAAPSFALALVAILSDFGLALVSAVPVAATTLIAANFPAFSRIAKLSVFAVGVALAVAVSPVLFPSTLAIREAASIERTDKAFAQVGGTAGQVARAVGAERPLARATVRSIAARDPEALEKAVVASRPSIAREEILRSLEQAWGGRVYAASGLAGVGTAKAPFNNVGIPRSVSYAENAFSAFVMAEHGWFGALGVIGVLIMLVISGLLWLASLPLAEADDPEDRARIALMVGGMLWFVVPTVYVALGNLAVVPLTGQNVPFLGLNSWADVLIVTSIASTLFVAALARPDTT